MAGNDQMPKVDLAKDRPKFSEAQLDHMRLVEKLNALRVTELQRLKRNNYITAGVIATCVLGIYGYSMFAVKQEKFLDELE